MEFTNFVASHPTELVGIILPPFIDYLNKEIPEDQESKRFLYAVGACLLVAVFMKWNELVSLNLADFSAYAAIIFTESQLVYNLYFKDSFVRFKLQEQMSPKRTDKIDTPAPTQTQEITPVG